jgi:hypothetical protein
MGSEKSLKAFSSMAAIEALHGRSEKVGFGRGSRYAAAL